MMMMMVIMEICNGEMLLKIMTVLFYPTVSGYGCTVRGKMHDMS